MKGLKGGGSDHVVPIIASIFHLLPTQTISDSNGRALFQILRTVTSIHIVATSKHVFLL